MVSPFCLRPSFEDICHFFAMLSKIGAGLFIYENLAPKSILLAA
jgi:hypothetical protein